MSNIVVQIGGGVGRCICAVPALERLAKSREVIVLTAHPEVFYYNPSIYKVYSLGREYLFDDVIQHCEFIFPEPYWDYNYYQQRTHLIDSFYTLLNKEDPPDNLKPYIYLSQEEMQEAERYIKQVRSQIGDRKLVAFQPFGAIFNTDTGGDNTHRSMTYDTADFILTSLFDECCFINFTSIGIKNKSMCTDEFTLRQRFALIPHCNYFIGIDSFAAHACYGMNLPGTQFIGGTNVINIGYPDYYHTVHREGYPKSYTAYRMSGSLEKNHGAMDFTKEELAPIIEEIKRRLRGKQNAKDNSLRLMYEEHANDGQNATPSVVD